MKVFDLKVFLITVLGVVSLQLNAQEISSVDELFQTKYETPLSIDSEVDLERTVKDDDKEGKKKEKKVNPKIYFGIKNE